MRNGCVLALLILLIAPAAQAQEEPEGSFLDDLDELIHVEADVRLRYGAIDGFFRIPRAGRPGSSAPRRPQLKELGFERVFVPEVDLGVGLGDLSLHMSARFMRFNGATLLEEGFVSRDVVFPSGSRVRSRIALDFQRVNLRYRFGWDLADGVRLELTPRFGLVIMRFDWEISSGSLEVSRAFTPVNLEVGLEARLELYERFALILDLSTSPPLTSHNGRPGLSMVELSAEWKVFDGDYGSGSVRLGLGADVVDFKDAQPLPNRIDITFGPYVSFGFHYAF